MERSERFWAEAQKNQSRNDQRFDSIEQSQRRLEKTLGDLVGHLQQREKGKLPTNVETNRVLAVEVSFDKPGRVKIVVTTCTCGQNKAVAQVEAPQVTRPQEIVEVQEVDEVVKSGVATPVEEASAKLAILEVKPTARVIQKQIRASVMPTASTW